MNTDKNGSLRVKQAGAWAVLGVFVAGFFVGPINAWTGPILGAWLVGTQRLRRGFLWMLVPSLLFGIPDLWRASHAGMSALLAFAAWSLLAFILGILPFTFYRAVGLSLRRFIATLALPVAGVLLLAVQRAWLPPNILHLHTLNPGSGYLPSDPYVFLFLTYWFAAALLWAWNRDFPTVTLLAGMAAFAAGATGLALLHVPPSDSRNLLFACASGVAALAVWAAFNAYRRRAQEYAPAVLRLLRSPSSSAPLLLQHESLVSPSSERFPMHNGIADLRRPEDMVGLNGKYNRLYEFIGGFYDDIQRVVCKLQGFDRDAYVMSYLGKLEVKPGDSVLETSVGTGLNFKYLPPGTELCGLDLSPEMLTNCRANLLRWQLDADLFLGNAECLPFADSSFDVVFHVGGINFFNDRAQAIREMIRVAKPGSRILIADETEEHVKAVYERGPITNLFYKNREEPVTPPIDLVPPEMLETRLEILNVVGKNRFYVLTFRKPPEQRVSLQAGGTKQYSYEACAAV